MGPESLVIRPSLLVRGPDSLVMGPDSLVTRPNFLVIEADFLVTGPYSLVMGPNFLLQSLAFLIKPDFLVVGSDFFSLHDFLIMGQIYSHKVRFSHFITQHYHNTGFLLSTPLPNEVLRHTSAIIITTNINITPDSASSLLHARKQHSVLGHRATHSILP